MKYSIRIASSKDQKLILIMIKEHALFEGHKFEYSKKHHQLNNIEALPITIFIVELDKEVVGYMSVIKQYSTWDMDWYLYLDCLYLTEEIRGQGIGFQLMQKLKVFAKESGINTIQWQTPQNNLPAIKFYQKLGAINKEKQRFFWPI